MPLENIPSVLKLGILSNERAVNSMEKEQALGNAIRNLVMLGWIRLQFSETMPKPAK